MIGELLFIGAGALLLCSPLWGAALFTAWLDRRPTPAQRWERNRANVERRRERITRSKWL